MARHTFKGRQIRTSVLLVLAIAAISATGLYLGGQMEQKAAAPAAVTLENDTRSIIERYRNKTDWGMAEVHTVASADVLQKAELVICGMPDDQTLEQLLKTLKEYTIQPSFFFSTLEIRANKDSISAINKAGYRIGILGDGSSASPAAGGENIVANLSRASGQLQLVGSIRPSAMLVYQQPSEELLGAAHSAYIDEVFVANAVIKTSDIATQEEAQQAISDAPYGGVLCLKLSTQGSGAEERMGWLLSALAKTDYTDTASLIAATNGVAAPSKALDKIYTTERAAAFTFAGLGNSRELSGVLEALDALSGKALFFVSKNEVEENQEDIKRILEAGNDLGIVLQASEQSTVSDVVKEILSTRELIQSSFNYTKDLPLHAAYGTPSQTLLDAAALSGFTVLSSSVNATKPDYLREKDAQVILDGVLPQGHGALQRGEIVHFQMNQYQQSDAVLGDLVKLMATQRNVYSLRSAMDIMNNAEHVYTYPLPEEAILPSVRDKIYPGQLDSANAFNEIQRRYYGIDWVDRASFLPGFSKEEIKQLDKTGLIPNNRNMVFLTFDDWGTDATITGLLDVLKKHNATATFFVRTNFVEANPSLLRAIALEGHTIGSHTDSHYPLSNGTENGKVYNELTDAQVGELKKDLVLSYDKLQSIVGDIEVDGQPALSRIFRPPTLAVSMKGLQAVFDCGFTYSVSGYYTSQDYKAQSAEKLAAALKRNTKSGAVIVMHMSDNSVYTAEALDQYLTLMEQSVKDRTRFSFCRLTDALPNPD